MILGPKMPHLAHFVHNESFSEKFKTVTSNHFLMAVIVR